MTIVNFVNYKSFLNIKYPVPQRKSLVRIRINDD